MTSIPQTPHPAFDHLLPANGAKGKNDHREILATLRFSQGGGRTFLQRQHVPYPFHITKPHVSDGIATLILQSASGGLYRGDRLRLDVSAGPGARAHVTSQAATVVHAALDPGITVQTRLDAESGALLAMTTDPYILFPGTTLSTSTEVTLGSEATAILAEGFAIHDPAGSNRSFGRLTTGCRVLATDGTVLVDEGGALDGFVLLGPGSPLGPYRAMGTVMVLGAAATRVDLSALKATLDGSGALAGITDLPNKAGLCVRLLAANGGRLSRALHTAAMAAITILTGSAPCRR